MPTIQVKFKQVQFLPAAAGYRSGRYYCTAKVDGTSVPVGRRGRAAPAPKVWRIRRRRKIRLNWKIDVDVTNKDSIQVEFAVHEAPVPHDPISGARWVVRNYVEPEQPLATVLRTNRGTGICEVQWTLKPKGRGSRRVDPRAVVASREAQGRTEFTTVSGAVQDCRVEIHPVMPPPTTPAAALPLRPGNARWRTTVGPWNTTFSHVDITAGDPLNVIPNPPVIPILGRRQHLGPRGAQRCAQLQFTYYRPRNLRFTRSDRRLTWRAITADGAPEVRFQGRKNYGSEVRVYGVDNGQAFDATNIPEVMFEVSYENTVVAKFRALVIKPRQIVARAQIIEYRPPPRPPGGGGPAPLPPDIPATRPADLETHRQIANRYLRQVGVEMVWDTDATITTVGARALPDMPGRFGYRARRRDWTYNTTYAYGVAPGRVNSRPGILNVVYVCRISAPVGSTYLGIGSDYPANAAGATISDNATGKLSSSWIKPSGFAPDQPAGTTNMTLLTESPGRTNNAVSLMIQNHGPGSDIGKTLAHEIGHLLNLGHRVEGKSDGSGDANSTTANAQMSGNGAWCDGIWHPPRQNIMHWTAGDDMAIGLDLIQAKAIHRSPLVQDP